MRGAGSRYRRTRRPKGGICSCAGAGLAATGGVRVRAVRRERDEGQSACGKAKAGLVPGTMQEASEKNKRLPKTQLPPLPRLPRRLTRALLPPGASPLRPASGGEVDTEEVRCLGLAAG